MIKGNNFAKLQIDPTTNSGEKGKIVTTEERLFVVINFPGSNRQFARAQP